MPAEWWDRVAIEPLDGAGEVLARALGDVTRDGVASLVLRVSEAGRYRLRLPDTGLAPARSEVLRVDASGAREQEIQLALAGARDPRTR